MMDYHPSKKPPQDATRRTSMSDATSSHTNNNNNNNGRAATGGAASAAVVNNNTKKKPKKIMRASSPPASTSYYNSAKAALKAASATIASPTIPRKRAISSLTIGSSNNNKNNKRPAPTAITVGCSKLSSSSSSPHHHHPQQQQQQNKKKPRRSPDPSAMRGQQHPSSVAAAAAAAAGTASAVTTKKKKSKQQQQQRAGATPCTGASTSTSSSSSSSTRFILHKRILKLMTDDLVEHLEAFRRRQSQQQSQQQQQQSSATSAALLSLFHSRKQHWLREADLPSAVFKKLWKLARWDAANSTGYSGFAGSAPSPSKRKKLLGATTITTTTAGSSSTRQLPPPPLPPLSNRQQSSSSSLPSNKATSAAAAAAAAKNNSSLGGGTKISRKSPLTLSSSAAAATASSSSGPSSSSSRQQLLPPPQQQQQKPTLMNRRGSSASSTTSSSSSSSSKAAAGNNNNSNSDNKYNDPGFRKRYLTIPGLTSPTDVSYEQFFYACLVHDCPLYALQYDTWITNRPTDGTKSDTKKKLRFKQLQKATAVVVGMMGSHDPGLFSTLRSHYGDPGTWKNPVIIALNGFKAKQLTHLGHSSRSCLSLAQRFQLHHRFARQVKMRGVQKTEDDRDWIMGQWDCLDSATTVPLSPPTPPINYQEPSSSASTPTENRRELSSSSSARSKTAGSSSSSSLNNNYDDPDFRKRKLTVPGLTSPTEVSYEQFFYAYLVHDNPSEALQLDRWINKPTNRSTVAGNELRFEQLRITTNTMIDMMKSHDTAFFNDCSPGTWSGPIIMALNGYKAHHFSRLSCKNSSGLTLTKRFRLLKRFVQQVKRHGIQNAGRDWIIEQWDCLDDPAASAGAGSRSPPRVSVSSNKTTTMTMNDTAIPRKGSVSSTAAIRREDTDAAEAKKKWTTEEHEEFIFCVDLHGNDWTKIAKAMGGSRSPKEVQEHARETDLIPVRSSSSSRQPEGSSKKPSMAPSASRETPASSADSSTTTNINTINEEDQADAEKRQIIGDLLVDGAKCRGDNDRLGIFIGERVSYWKQMSLLSEGRFRALWSEIKPIISINLGYAFQDNNVEIWESTTGGEEAEDTTMMIDDNNNDDDDGEGHEGENNIDNPEGAASKVEKEIARKRAADHKAKERQAGTEFLEKYKKNWKDGGKRLPHKKTFVASVAKEYAVKQKMKSKEFVETAWEASRTIRKICGVGLTKEMIEEVYESLRSGSAEGRGAVPNQARMETDDERPTAPAVEEQTRLFDEDISTGPTTTMDAKAIEKRATVAGSSSSNIDGNSLFDTSSDDKASTIRKERESHSDRAAGASLERSLPSPIDNNKDRSAETSQFESTEPLTRSGGSSGVSGHDIGIEQTTVARTNDDTGASVSADHRPASGLGLCASDAVADANDDLVEEIVASIFDALENKSAKLFKFILVGKRSEWRLKAGLEMNEFTKLWDGRVKQAVVEHFSQPEMADLQGTVKSAFPICKKIPKKVSSSAAGESAALVDEAMAGSEPPPAEVRAPINTSTATSSSLPVPRSNQAQKKVSAPEVGSAELVDEPMAGSPPPHTEKRAPPTASTAVLSSFPASMSNRVQKKASAVEEEAAGLGDEPMAGSPPPHTEKRAPPTASTAVPSSLPASMSNAMSNRVQKKASAVEEEAAGLGDEPMAGSPPPHTEKRAPPTASTAVPSSLPASMSNRVQKKASAVEEEAAGLGDEPMVANEPPRAEAVAPPNTSTATSSSLPVLKSNQAQKKVSAPEEESADLVDEPMVGSEPHQAEVVAPTNTSIAGHSLRVPRKRMSSIAESKSEPSKNRLEELYHRVLADVQGAVLQQQEKEENANLDDILKTSEEKWKEELKHMPCHQFMALWGKVEDKIVSEHGSSLSGATDWSFLWVGKNYQPEKYNFGTWDKVETIIMK